MQVNATLTSLNLHEQDVDIGAAGEAALVAALQVRDAHRSIDGTAPQI